MAQNASFSIRVLRIVELQGGNFELRPDPNDLQVRLTQGLRWTIAFLAPLAAGLSLVFSLQHNMAQLGGALALSAFLLGGGLVVWFSFRTPLVRVNAEEISAFGLDSFFLPTRMLRTDLAYIFRGRALLGYRYKAWQPAYFLVTRDDTPRITLLGESFTDERMTALANRLGVPIKGDFTAQVQ